MVITVSRLLREDDSEAAGDGFDPLAWSLKEKKANLVLRRGRLLPLEP